MIPFYALHTPKTTMMQYYIWYCRWLLFVDEKKHCFQHFDWFFFFSLMRIAILFKLSITDAET